MYSSCTYDQRLTANPGRLGSSWLSAGEIGTSGLVCIKPASQLRGIFAPAPTVLP